MVMKKASGGDSPLWQVPGRASGPSQSRVDDGSGLLYVSWKIDRGLRVFPSRRIYRRKGDMRRWARWPHYLVARPGASPRHHMVWLAPGSPSSLLLTPSRVGQYRNFGFSFVQFREYFLCSFSRNTKTAENRELALWHLVNRVVLKNA
jgi:hypothetical protein